MEAETVELEILDQGCDCSEDVMGCCTGSTAKVRATQ